MPLSGTNEKCLIMKKMIFTTFAVAATTSLTSVLSTIEQNNTTLKALRESADANKLANRTDIYLLDPEIGFNYLWGDPSEVPNRKDFNASQSFDFATKTGLKCKIANLSNELINWQYSIDKMDIMLEAKLFCLDLIYYNALLNELMIRLDHAIVIDSLQKKKLDSGERSAVNYDNCPTYATKRWHKSQPN